MQRRRVFTADSNRVQMLEDEQNRILNQILQEAMGCAGNTGYSITDSMEKI